MRRIHEDGKSASKEMLLNLDWDVLFGDISAL